MKIKNKIYVLGIVLLIGFIVNSCDDDQQNPTCQEACIQTQDNHLGRNDDGTLAVCDHNGKTIQGECQCTEQTGTLVGTAIHISKADNVTVVQMNTGIAKVQEVYNDYLTTGQKNKFKDGRVTEIRIVSGDAINKTGTFLQVGHSAVVSNIGDFFELEAVASVQPQTKSIFLVNSENKNLKWVAKSINDRIMSVNDLLNTVFDKAFRISI